MLGRPDALEFGDDGSWANASALLFNYVNGILNIGPPSILAGFGDCYLRYAEATSTATFAEIETSVRTGPLSIVVGAMTWEVTEPIKVALMGSEFIASLYKLRLFCCNPDAPAPAELQELLAATPGDVGGPVSQRLCSVNGDFV